MFSNNSHNVDIDCWEKAFEKILDVFDKMTFDAKFRKSDIEFNIETKNRCWFIK